MVVGIGDDAAVVEARPGTQLIACCDLSVDGVHFRSEWSPPHLIGRKALAVTLSDVAAMGGTPRYAMISVAFPGKTHPDFVKGLLDGIFDIAEEFDVAIIGGDTSGSPDGLFIDTTVLGECPRGKAIRRSGARVGDLIFVTGGLGASALGLALLQQGYRIDGDEIGDESVENRARREAMMRHLAPCPRMNAGQVIGGGGIATSMIDLSDGLSTDLSHILEESGCGAVIQERSLPIAEAVGVLASPRSELDAVSLALHGGEEYELLFTAGADARDRVASVSQQVGLRMTEIGKIVEGDIFQIDRGDRVELISPAGYEHTI